MCISLGILDGTSLHEISNLSIQDLQELSNRLKEAIGSFRIEKMNKKTSQVILAIGELYPKSSLEPGMSAFGADSKKYTLKSMESRKEPAFEVIPIKGEPFLMERIKKFLPFQKRENTCY